MTLPQSSRDLATFWLAIPGRAGFFSRHNVQTGSGDHTVSYPIYTRVLSLGVKQLKRKANYSRSSSAKVKNAQSYVCHLHLHDAMLKLSTMNNFTFTLLCLHHSVHKSTLLKKPAEQEHLTETPEQAREPYTQTDFKRILF